MTLQKKVEWGSERSPFTLRLAEHLALAAVNATSPVWGNLQLYKTRVCLAPSSTISTSCRKPDKLQHFSKNISRATSWYIHFHLFANTLILVILSFRWKSKSGLSQNESELDHTGKRISAEMYFNVTYSRWTEDFAVQFPLAVDIVLTELDLKSSCLSVKHLSAVHWPNHLDVASWWLRERTKFLLKT